MSYLVKTEEVTMPNWFCTVFSLGLPCGNEALQTAWIPVVYHHVRRLHYAFGALNASK
jgi:hypothetical protein